MSSRDSHASQRGEDSDASSDQVARLTAELARIRLQFQAADQERHAAVAEARHARFQNDALERRVSGYLATQNRLELENIRLEAEVSELTESAGALSLSGLSRGPTGFDADIPHLSTTRGPDEQIRGLQSANADLEADNARLTDWLEQSEAEVTDLRISVDALERADLDREDLLRRTVGSCDFLQQTLAALEAQPAVGVAAPRSRTLQEVQDELAGALSIRKIWRRT